MFKVNVGGVNVEVDSISGVKELISAFATLNSYVDKANKAVEANIARKNKPVSKSLPYKISKYNQWLKEEVEYIWNNRHLGVNAISKTPALIERHNPKAVGMMFYKVTRNLPHSRYKVNREVKELIDSFHSVNRIPLRINQ